MTSHGSRHQPSAARGWGSRLLLGAFAVAALAMAILIALSFIVPRVVDRLVEEYTDVAPADIPRVESTPDEKEEIESRVSEFVEALEEGAARAPLELSEREINVVLQDAIRKIDEHAAARIHLLEGRVRAQVSLPIDAKLPLGPWSRDLRGRFVNGTAEFVPRIRGGRFEFELVSFEVGGKGVPRRMLNLIADELESSGILDDPDAQRVAQRLSGITIRNGSVVLEPRNK